MPKVTFKVVGAEVVRNGLQNLSRDIPRISRLRIKEAMDRIADRLKKYPPPRPMQTYVRTYRLRDSVTVLRVGDMAYSVSVDPVRKGKHYGKYVIGTAKGEGQAWMHKNRWKLFAEISEKEINNLPKTMEEHIRQRIERLWFLMTDYYGICETGLATILSNVSGLSGKVKKSDYSCLENGDTQFIVLQPDQNFDSGKGQSWAMEFKNWHIILELYQRYTSEAETMTNFRTLRSNVINEIQKYPTLNKVDGVLGVQVSGEGGIRDVTDQGDNRIIYYRMQTIRIVIRQQIDDAVGGEYT